MFKAFRPCNSLKFRYTVLKGRRKQGWFEEAWKVKRKTKSFYQQEQTGRLWVTWPALEGSDCWINYSSQRTLVIGTITKCFPISRAMIHSYKHTHGNEIPLRYSQPYLSTYEWKWKSWLLFIVWKNSTKARKSASIKWWVTDPADGFCATKSEVLSFINYQCHNRTRFWLQSFALLPINQWWVIAIRLLH